MKRISMIMFVVAALAACGGDDNNGSTNDGGRSDDGTNDGGPNGGDTNDGGTDDGGPNDGGTNDGGTNDGSTNDGGETDFISADVDGVNVVATEEGGVEPMEGFVQLRKTTGEASTPVQIFRITIPDTTVASYDCATDDVSVTYSELNGQLVDNWAAMDTCTIDVTSGGESAGDNIAGTFTASASNGATTVELTNGQFSITR